MSMHLKIITKNINEQSEVVVDFKADSLEKRFVVEDFSAQASQAFKGALVDYFLDYPLNPRKFNKLSGIQGKAISVGKALGDELLGENHELIHVKEVIEDDGYHNLDVEIVMRDQDVSQQRWESLILNDSEYVLSSATRTFVRTWENAPKHELQSFDLVVESKTNQDVNKMFGAAEEEEVGEDRPLEVLCHLSNVQTAAVYPAMTDYLNTYVSVLSKGAQAQLNLDSSTCFTDLKESLKRKQTEQIHVFHYHGPLRSTDSNVEVLLGDDWVNAKDFIDLLVEHEIPVLFVTPIEHSEADGIAIPNMIAKLSHQAALSGLNNLIALDHATVPHIAFNVLEVVLEKVADGFELAQAVVEGRKSLLANGIYMLNGNEPLAIGIWSALVHYSQQPMQFFGKACPSDPESNSQLAPLHEKLFGFQSQMLAPLLVNSSDGYALPFIRSLLSEHQDQPAQISLLHGVTGIGKTHLIHVVNNYLALSDHIDYGFYFDFSKDNYLATDILNMIQEVTGLESLVTNVAELSKFKCCIVFDGLSATDMDNNDLKALLRQFQDQGQYVILASDIDLSEHFSELATTYELAPLTEYDQHKLISHTLAEKFKHPIDLEHIAPLSSKLQGNPWVIKRVLPLLDSAKGIEQLIDDVEKNLIQPESSTPLRQRLHAWQWRQQPDVLQGLLLLIKDLPGVLFEMISTVCDRSNVFQPAKELLALLGDDAIKVSEAISRLESAGFLQRFPHGHTLSYDCISFVNEQHNQNVEDDDVQRKFAQVICEGVRFLVSAMMKQPNTGISNNLIINRKYWGRYLEIVLHAKDYQLFFTTVEMLRQLFVQVGIEEDLLQWQSSLLSTFEFNNELSTDDKVAWLMIASSVLNRGIQVDQKVLTPVVKSLELWLSEVQLSDETRLPLFQQIISFLENCYKIDKQWHKRITIMEKAASAYQPYSAWQKLIWAWKNLADSYSALNMSDKVLEFEKFILNEVPYDTAPDEFKIKQFLDIIVARIARHELELAQQLLDELKSTHESEQLANVLEGLQCDIHLANEDYVSAIPYYRELWAQPNLHGQPEIAHQVFEKLQLIKSKVGEDIFHEHFDSHLLSS